MCVYLCVCVRACAFQCVCVCVSVCVHPYVCLLQYILISALFDFVHGLQLNQFINTDFFFFLVVGCIMYCCAVHTDNDTHLLLSLKRKSKSTPGNRLGFEGEIDEDDEVDLDKF